jgi:para-nitrobenzyl esterase
MSVATLLAAPAAHGLFRRAICQSGAGGHSIPAGAARRGADRLCELLGLTAGDIDGLRRAPIDALVGAAFRIAYLEAGELLCDVDPWRKMLWAPVEDGEVLPGPVPAAVAGGSARDVDLLIGSNADEYNLFIWGVAEHLRPASTDPSEYWPSGESAAAMNVYAANRPGADALALFAAVAGDASFWLPAVRLAEAQASAGGNVWMYSFDWTTPVEGGRLGACHGLELPFLFGGPTWPAFVGDHPPAELGAAMRKAWTQFAATGDPGGEPLPGWPVYDLARRPVMSLDETSRLLEDPRGNERRLWAHV